MSRHPDDIKEVEALNEQICNAPNEELAEILESNSVWNWPPGDLVNWCEALNAIDSVLEQKIAEYGLDKTSPRPAIMAPDDSRLIRACLTFTAMLLRNCASRSIYSSQERIFQLCDCGDIDVLVLAMEVVLLLSHRYVRGDSIRRKTPPSKQVKQHLLEVAKFYPPAMPTSFIQKTVQLSSSPKDDAANDKHKYEHYSLADTLNTEKKYPSKWKSLNFQFYSTNRPKPAAELKSKKDKKKPSVQHEGLSTITIPEEKLRRLSLQDLYNYASSHELPDEFNALYLLACLNAKAFNSLLPECLILRAKLLRIKCMAFSAVCCFCSTDFTSTNLFEVEAYTFGFMVDLISPLNTHIPKEVFNTLVTCLEVISLKRVWGTEIVRLMGGNVRHGLLYQLMKHIGKLVREGSEEINEFGYLSFFEMLENLVETKVISTRFAAGGLLQDLTEFLAIKTDKKRLATLVSSILTDFFLAAPENVDLFAEINGFKTLIEVIDYEVSVAIATPILQNGLPRKRDPENKVALDQVDFLGNALNTLFTLVDSDLGDRLQGLIDSSILKTLNSIFSHSILLGEFVLSSALSVVFKTLHNEPTAFAIFNESKVIDSIIEHYGEFFAPTFAWPTILVEMLGAISLNSLGLKKVIDNKLIRLFFRTFLSHQCAEEMQSEASILPLATCFEELSRHFPVFRPIILKEMMEIAKVLPGHVASEVSSVEFYGSADEKVLSKWENDRGASILDCFLRFCSNLFEGNRNWARKVPETVPYSSWLPLIALNSPSDYARSNAFASLRMITEVCSEGNKLYAFSPLLDSIALLLKSHSIQEFVKHPHNENFFGLLSKNPVKATLFFRELHKFHNYVWMFYRVFFEPFNGDVGEIKKVLSVFTEDMSVFESLFLLLRKCITEQAFLHTVAPSEEYSHISKLFSSDELGFKVIHEKTPLLTAKDTNMYQYRNWLTLIGVSVQLFIKSIAQFLLFKDFEHLSLSQKKQVVQLHKTSIWNLEEMLGSFSTLNLDAEFFAVRATCKTIIRVCSNKEKDGSLNIPALLVICAELLIMKKFVALGVSIFHELENMGPESFKGHLNASEVLIHAKVETLKDLINFFSRLISEEDIAFLQTLRFLFNCEYCDDDELLKEGFISVNAIQVFTFLSETIGTNSSIYKNDNYSIFSVLPVKVTKCLFDLIHVAWMVDPSDTFYPLNENWMGESQAELDFMITLGLDESASLEYLKQVKSILLTRASTTKDPKTLSHDMYDKIVETILASNYKKTIIYEPETTDAKRKVEQARELEDKAMFSRVFIKIGALLKLLEAPFVQTVGLLGYKNEIAKSLCSEISKLQGPELATSIVEVGNMVRLLQLLLFLTSVTTHLLEAHNIQNYFQDFVNEFLESIIANPDLVDSTYCAMGLKFITPLLATSPEFSSLPYHNDVNQSFELKQRLCKAIFPLKPHGNHETVIILCNQLYLLAIDEQFKECALQSELLRYVLTQLGVFCSGCELPALRSLQNAVVQLIRVSYESKAYLEGMIQTSLRQLFKIHSLLDMQTILDESAFIVGRAPGLYVDVASKMLRIENCADMSHTRTQMYLLDPADIPEGSLDDSQQASQTPPKKVGLVTLLLTELMKVSREDWFSTPENLSENANGGDSKLKPFAKMAQNNNFRTMCFILQMLCELLSSYMSAKLEFITFSKKDLSGSENKPRSTSLNFFIHQLLSVVRLSDSKSVNDVEKQRRTTICSLARLCLFSLTSTPELNKNEAAEKEEDPDLAIVRKLTADLISKILRDSVPFTHPISSSYSKALGIFNLCSMLLSTKHSEVFLTLFNESATKMDNFYFASALLDALVPSQLSFVLSNLDLNFPGVKKVFDSGLRVLTILGRIKLNNANLLESAGNGEKDDDDIGDVEDKDETPDLFRNSTLGLYDIDMDSDEYEEIYDENSFEGMSGSDMSEDDIASGDEEDYDMESELEGEEVFEDDDQEGGFEGFDSDDSENDIEIIEDLEIQSESGAELSYDEEENYEYSDFDEDYPLDLSEENEEFEIEDGDAENVEWDRWISAFGDQEPNSLHGNHMANDLDSDLEITDLNVDDIRLQPNEQARALMNSFVDALRPSSLRNFDYDDELLYGLDLESPNPIVRLENLEALMSRPPVALTDDATQHMVLRSTSERWRNAFSAFMQIHSSKLLKVVKQKIIENVKPDSVERYKEHQESLKKKLQVERQAEEEEEEHEQEDERRHSMQSQSSPLEVAEVEYESESEASSPDHVPIFVQIGGREVDIGGTDIDPEFFEALPEDMREEVFTQHVSERRANASERHVREIDPDFLDALPVRIREDILNHERLTRLVDGLFNLDSNRGDDDRSDLEETDSNEQPKKNEKEPAKKKIFHTPLIDRSGVASLVRLLYVPVPINQREGIYKALVSVCHNKQTRIETVNMLLAVLCDGLSSQRSLRRSFNQLTQRSTGFSKDKVAQLGFTLPMNATPITIGIQILEAVLNLLENILPLRVFMLTDHENNYLSKKHTKKYAGTNAAQEDRFPINLMLKLLDNPILSEEYFFIDLLASVVHYATLPLLSLKDPVGKQIPPLFSTKFIPDKNLKLITRILSSGECLNSTFKRTMSSIQHLSLIKDSQNVLSAELSKNAEALGVRVVLELKTVTDVLISNPSDDALNNKLTAEFTALSSNQAKLLRVLTALDYMYNTRVDKNRSNLSDLYKDLKLGSLWEALSECLSVFASNPHVSSNATALLPLIEALMVVCKHSKLKDIQIKEMMKFQNKKVNFTEEPLESLFFSFTEEHKKILNQMVRANPNLMSGPFSMLVRNPRVLEFDNKRNYFNRQLHDKNEVPQKMAFTVRRDQVFLDSYRSLFFKTAEEFKKSHLQITFKGEMGVDAGGLTREWYQVLSRQMFNPDYALFTPVSSDENTFHPNRTSHVNPEHLSFFKFIGRVIGKSIFDECVLDCHFSRAVYKKILDRPVSLKDMETLDLDYFKSLMWMLENDITDIITEDFSVESDDYGEHKIIDLIPNGRNIAVTEENKHEYVKLVVEYRLQTSVQEQMSNFITGFHDIIPKDLVAIFDEQELELLISGLPDIDVQDWQNNTVYQNYSASSEQIQWFWRAVRSFDNEERAKLLQFATGTSKVPLNGFKELKGANNVSKFNIHRDYGSTDRLPSSHTCFNQIDLPVYESYETLRGSLLLAITEGYEGFQLA